VDVSTDNGAGIVPVLLYHSISDARSQDERFTVSRAQFEDHADAIEASGRVTVSITDLARGLRGESSLPARVAAITFDDGFADNYDAVLSLLDRQLRSTLYVITGAIGSPHRLTPSQVAELARMPGVEMGAHTVRHPYLDELDQDEIGDEVGSSKRELEDLVQRPVGSFAYPHGAYDQRVRQAVIDAGYHSAVGVKNAISHLEDDPYAIARWTVTADTPASRIGEILEGRDVTRAWSRQRVRTRAYRGVRRTRRRVAHMLVHEHMSAGTGAGTAEAP
jgi:peptidoglycan/xylan/chitin deacetylase (PgdA/CDA1 family)